MRALLVVAIVLAPSVATAQRAWRYDAWMGMFASDSTRKVGSSAERGEPTDGGLQLGALVVRRSGGLEAGAIVDAGLGFDDGGVLQAALTGGPTFDLGRENHVTLHGEVGVSTHSNLGGGLFSRNIGGDDTATLPYLGVRLALNHGLFNGPWVAGVAVHFRRELGETRNTVHVEECFFGCSTSTETFDVGGSFVGASLTLGRR